MNSPRLILILGGARSGKSRFALELAAGLGRPVLFVATAASDDDEMAARIAQHQRERPATWLTVEIPSRLGHRLPQQVGDAGVVIIDCLTVLLGNLVSAAISADGQTLEQSCHREIDDLLAAIADSAACFIVVSNEVGLGLVPAYASGRAFRDLLGWANQRLAQHAAEVYLMIAGLPFRLKGKGCSGVGPWGVGKA